MKAKIPMKGKILKGAVISLLLTAVFATSVRSTVVVNFPSFVADRAKEFLTTYRNVILPQLANQLVNNILTELKLKAGLLLNDFLFKTKMQENSQKAWQFKRTVYGIYQENKNNWRDKYLCGYGSTSTDMCTDKGGSVLISSFGKEEIDPKTYADYAFYLDGDLGYINEAWKDFGGRKEVPPFIREEIARRISNLQSAKMNMSQLVVGMSERLYSLNELKKDMLAMDAKVSAGSAVFSSVSDMIANFQNSLKNFTISSIQRETNRIVNSAFRSMAQKIEIPMSDGSTVEVSVVRMTLDSLKSGVNSSIQQGLNLYKNHLFHSLDGYVKDAIMKTANKYQWLSPEQRKKIQEDLLREATAGTQTILNSMLQNENLRFDRVFDELQRNLGDTVVIVEDLQKIPAEVLNQMQAMFGGAQIVDRKIVDQTLSSILQQERMLPLEGVGATLKYTGDQAKKDLLKIQIMNTLQLIEQMRILAEINMRKAAVMNAQMAREREQIVRDIQIYKKMAQGTHEIMSR